jgi:hypothetical protein
MRFLAVIVCTLALAVPVAAQTVPDKPAPAVVMTEAEAQALAEAQAQLAAASETKRQVELGVSRGYATQANLERAAAAEEMWRYYVEVQRLKVLLRASGIDPATPVTGPPVVEKK